MIKNLTIAALAVVGFIAVGGSAQAAQRGGRCRSSATTPYVAQATDGNGYRTYSYEPGVAPASPRYFARPTGPSSGFHSAGWKITGDR